jgi:hypothetical protein
MTSEQAIKLIDDALASLRVSRQEHALLLQALEVLRKKTNERLES